jgi:hypothetical protein
MTTTLHDQIGVMGIIDKLRHEKVKLSELLSISEQREAIQKRIEAYYQAQGVEVDTATIEEGIRVWFADRLTAPLNEPTRLEAIYMNRSHWLSKNKYGLKVSLGLIVVGLCLNYGFEDYQHRQYQKLVGKYQLLVKEYDDVSLELHAHREDVASISNPALDALMRAHTSQHNAALALSESLKNDVQAIDNLIAVKNFDSNYASIMTDFSGKMIAYNQEKYNLDKAHKKIAETQRISMQFARFEEQNKALYAQYPALNQASLSLKQLLESPESTHEKIKTSFASLQEKIAFASVVNQKLAKAEAIRAHLLSFKLSQYETQKVEGLYAEIRTSLVTLDKNTDGGFKYFESLGDIIGVDLQLLVNPDGKGKTGVERTYDTSGGKSWYIIAGAVKPSGEVVDVLVKNRETGVLEKVSKFGVKVSHAKYQAVGRDKKDDGVVRDNVLANKPAGSIEFSPLNDVEIEYLTRW